jgi:hypothetical protein
MANQLDGGDGPRWRRNQHLLEIAAMPSGDGRVDEPTTLGGGIGPSS